MPKLADLSGGAAATDWTAIPGVSIIAVLANQRYNPQGKLHDVMDVTYQLDGKPGTFTTHVTADLVWQEAAHLYITNQAHRINALYSLGG